MSQQNQEHDNTLHLHDDPIDSFLEWLKGAETAGLPEPTAMTLATATRAGVPSARIVLFKGLSGDDAGRRSPRFFTNYESRKSHQLNENPFAALVFHWTVQERQIRFEGRVEKVSETESNAYFQSRARGSRIGAWASPQSQKISDRTVLEEKVAATESRFEGQEIPCPPNWGGWRLVPDRIEFWHGGTYRLHDRFVYEWNGAKWTRSRLAP